MWGGGRVGREQANTSTMKKIRNFFGDPGRRGGGLG